MTEVQENPLGIDGFEFVEFTAPDAALLHSLFRHLGFTAIARHRERKVTLYRQGDINFLVNEEPDSFAADFARTHGPSACGFAIRVADAARARAWAIDRGAAALSNKPATLPVRTPVIEGIGGSALYLVDRYGARGSIYDAHFEYLDDVERNPAGFGLTFIDHLTHNVYQGNMDKWAGFYERIFNFREIRYFDIKGAQTGLVSRAMTAPDGMVRIPINEATDNKSQIAEYLDEYHGEGIQHIALFTDDIYASVEALRADGIEFLDVPETYYEMVDERVSDHKEDLERMRENRILIDADKETQRRLLLQIFTQTCVGPIFFEIIQRKGNEGFGEGNFQALFESIERDQMRRGVI
ncbi:MAG TPA: 4-hydroxyphenylpyruvate dioxygenase [Gammaproteobacteria bacterium]|nr:4-hydroxyphenylpyruvate dioxygenase [Gammaproteobacteria bacterium]